MISEKEIEHLAELARIEISAEQKKKLAHDLEKILAHVKELSEVNTGSAEPVTGGTRNKNGFRDDELKHSDFKSEKSTEAFPEKERGFLKIPPVFE